MVGGGRGQQQQQQEQGDNSTAKMKFSSTDFYKAGMASPMSCDTFVSFPPSSQSVIFGKNSDRPAKETQSIRHYPAQDHVPHAYTACCDGVGDGTDGGDSSVRCTYLTIPQVKRTHAVLLSQIDWMWGAEMGANECGVVIGNEAVWTIEPDEGKDKPKLLGMDLVRLGLERGSTAREALDVITSLLELHGQGGACAENDPKFTYHNSFMIVSYQEAYILETAGRQWVAERITEGTRNISNGLTIRTSYDLHSASLHRDAQDRGLWKPSGATGGERLDFAATFADGGAAELHDDVENPDDSRQAQGRCLMQSRSTADGLFTTDSMMEILRDHASGICMHGAFETTSSMVSELKADGTAQHWMTGKPYPCKSEFLLQSFP
jgi:secernin